MKDLLSIAAVTALGMGAASIGANDDEGPKRLTPKVDVIAVGGDAPAAAVVAGDDGDVFVVRASGDAKAKEKSKSKRQRFHFVRPQGRATAPEVVVEEVDEEDGVGRARAFARAPKAGERTAFPAVKPFVLPRTFSVGTGGSAGAAGGAGRWVLAGPRTAHSVKRHATAPRAAEPECDDACASACHSCGEGGGQTISITIKGGDACVIVDGKKIDLDEAVEHGLVRRFHGNAFGVASPRGAFSFFGRGDGEDDEDDDEGEDDGEDEDEEDEEDEACDEDDADDADDDDEGDEDRPNLWFSSGDRRSKLLSDRMRLLKTNGGKLLGTEPRVFRVRPSEGKNGLFVLGDGEELEDVTVAFQGLGTEVADLADLDGEGVELEDFDFDVAFDLDDLDVDMDDFDFDFSFDDVDLEGIEAEIEGALAEMDVDDAGEIGELVRDLVEDRVSHAIDLRTEAIEEAHEMSEAEADELEEAEEELLERIEELRDELSDLRDEMNRIKKQMKRMNVRVF